jgi:hypothetical protein
MTIHWKALDRGAVSNGTSTIFLFFFILIQPFSWENVFSEFLSKNIPVLKNVKGHSFMTGTPAP